MQELLIVGVVALLVVGPKRLPEVAQMLGKGYAQIKKATDDLQESIKVELEAKRNEELKKKFPDLAVVDPKAEGAQEGASPAGGEPGAAGPAEVPTHFGEGEGTEYGLSTSHPIPSGPALPEAPSPGEPPSGPGKDIKNG